MKERVVPGRADLVTPPVALFMKIVPACLVGQTKRRPKKKKLLPHAYQSRQPDRNSVDHNAMDT